MLSWDGRHLILYSLDFWVISPAVCSRKPAGLHAPYTPVFPSSTKASQLYSSPSQRSVAHRIALPPIMYSSKKNLQARFLPNFRGRPRTSNPSTPSLNPTSHPFSNGWSRGASVHERLSFCEDDLLDLDSEDFSEASQYLRPESQGLTPHSTCSSSTEYISFNFRGV